MKQRAYHVKEASTRVSKERERTRHARVAFLAKWQRLEVKVRAIAYYHAPPATQVCLGLVLLVLVANTRKIQEARAACRVNPIRTVVELNRFAAATQVLRKSAVPASAALQANISHRQEMELAQVAQPVSTHQQWNQHLHPPVYLVPRANFLSTLKPLPMQPASRVNQESILRLKEVMMRATACHVRPENTRLL